MDDQRKPPSINDVLNAIRAQRRTDNEAMREQPDTAPVAEDMDNPDPVDSGRAVKSSMHKQRPCPACSKSRMNAIQMKGVDQVAILHCPWCGLKIRAFVDMGAYYAFGTQSIDIEEIKKNGGYTYGPPPMHFEFKDASFSPDGQFKTRQIKREEDWDWTKAEANPSADFEEYLTLKKLNDNSE